MSDDDFLIAPGAYARTKDDKVIQITHLLDMSRVVGRSLENGHPEIFEVASLQPTEQRKGLPGVASINDKSWQRAKEMYAVIQPLLEMPNRSRKDIEEAAEKIGRNPATVYRWIGRYLRSMAVASLVRSAPDGGADGSRLDPRVEGILRDVIYGEGLTLQRHRPARLFREVHRRCKALGVKTPHINTVRNRMEAIPLALSEKRRRGDKAGSAYDPLPGIYSEAKWPLQVVQIDHTPLDVIIVDDDTRKPIGRAFLTVAIDVYSRVVVGHFISLDHPGDHSVGLCLVDAILPKERKLAKYKISTRCPVYGKPSVVHADNAGEFRGDMLKRAAENRVIDLQWRPVKKPHYGAHIERLCGTLNHALKQVPGATFSNPAERGAYDAEQHAAMTFDEVSEWIAVRVYSIYHVAVHSGIGTTPMHRYEQGFLGDGDKPGRGMPPRVVDERRLRIEFLPYELRTVQNYGIEIDKVTYYADTLRPWINAQDPDEPSKRRKFFVYRDPRDISVVFFYDPEMREYYDIPYADSKRKAISLWDLRAARKYLAEANAGEIDEEALFAAHDRLLEIERSAVEKTKKVRRDHQRRKTREKSKQDYPIPTKGYRAVHGDQHPTVGADRSAFSELGDVIPDAYDVDD
ncbi:MAG TPA: Mu transposase C-terminal domain-containing protein [Solimonas sp.]